MGLFLATFPGVKPRFMGWMAPAWKAPLVRAWKARFLPQILPHTENAPEQDIDSLVGRLASGTEDVHPDSLYWQRISRDGDLMTRLTHYLPYEFWLGCPAWINTTIANYIRERADQTDWSPEFTLRENRNQSNSSRVNHVSLLWQEIFTHGQITHRKASRILRIPPKKSRHLLERMARRDELCKVGAEPMPHFTLPLPEIIDRVKARRQNRELWHGY
jgi:hypothetical protein